METEDQSRLDQLEQKIALLEKEYTLTDKTSHVLGKAFDHNVSENVSANAKIIALLCLLEEIADHMGVDHDVFQKRFEHYCNHWHERLLHTAENIDPGIAAKIDNRRDEDIGRDDTPPPLFSF